MKSRKGSLTVEASIALTAFMFIVVMVLSFSNVYRAQSIVSHATLQASQSLAIETYYRETVSESKSADLVSKLIKLTSLIGGDLIAGLDDGFASLGDSGTNITKIIKKAFAYSIADNVDTADKILEDAGISDGLDGIDFSYSAIKDGDIIVHAKYKVKMPFSFFGEMTIELSKSTKVKAFKKIEDNNGYITTETESESEPDDTPGSSGGGFRF